MTLTKAQAADLAEYQQRLDNHIENVRRLCEYFTKLANSTIAYDPDDLATRYRFLESKYATFEEFWQLCKTNGLQCDPDVERDVQEEFFRAMAIATRFKRLNAAPSKSTSAPSPVVIQAPAQDASLALPPISLPKFGGDPKEFQGFMDMFEVIINEHPSLSDARKFVHLRGALQGEALRLVEDLPLHESSYKIAVKTLKERYDHRITVIRLHLHKILDFPPISRPTAPELRELSISVRKAVASLKSHDIPVESWDILLVEILTLKLDLGTRRRFESDHLTSNKFATLEDFLKFIDSKASVLENTSSTSNKQIQSTSRSSSFHAATSGNQRQRTSHTNNTSNHKTRSCQVCHSNEYHPLYSCDEFNSKMSTRDRREFIAKQHRCFNCLGAHEVLTCRSKLSCRYCGRRHHSLLHVEDYPKRNTEGDNSKSSAVLSHQPLMSELSNVTHTAEIHSASTYHCTVDSQIILGTAIVKLPEYSSTNARCLIDSGSQTNFVTRALVEQINAPIKQSSVEVKGISGHKTPTTGTVSLRIASHATKFTMMVECVVLPSITSNLPQQPVAIEKISIPAYVKLADSRFGTPAPIDILLGADVFCAILAHTYGGSIKALANGPSLLNSKLGWIVMGSAPIKPTSNQVNNVFTSTVNLHAAVSQTIDEKIERFWRIDDVDALSTKTQPTRAEELLLSSLQQVQNRYQVELLFKTTELRTQLGDSYYMAVKQFHALERRFETNPALFNAYKAFIDEYVLLGHATYINFQFTPNGHAEVNGYFMPHHAVIKESSTSPIRVVFNASAKTTTGTSLNDTQHAGTPVQPKLHDTLLRFRMHRYAIKGDIAKMYRQFLVAPKHQKYQRIVWRESPALPLQHIQLKTITYGIASAPFAATRIMNYIAETAKQRFPLASNALLTSAYVDDILCGHDTIEKAQALQSELRELCSQNGLHLRKWCTNHPELLANIPTEDIENKSCTISDDPYETKALGLTWEPANDVFRITVPSFDATTTLLTKRIVLSLIMRIFDPLGLVAPIVMVAKMFMQQIWEIKISWDDALPDSFTKPWLTFVKGLIDLQFIENPRWILTQPNPIETRIYGFCDASTKGYGAALYVYATYLGNSSSCQLLCAKGKVAPLKKITIVRLELEAAVLLATLYYNVRHMLPKHQTCVLFSDSQITIDRIANHGKRADPFTAHRLTKIASLAPHAIWRHVASKDNPADILSRGATPESLLNSTLWWHGPKFLQENFETPTCNVSTKTESKHEATALIPFAATWMEYFRNHSSWPRLQKTMAYVFRFIRALKLKRKITHELELEEVEEASTFIIRQAQFFSFPHIYKKIITNQPLNDTSVAQLFPFIDNSNTLRVTGRLQNTELQYERKHPAILPSHNHITELIFRHEHSVLLHTSANNTLQQLRLQYWPLGGKREANRILSTCITCFKLSAKVADQLMGSLPTERIQQQRAFLCTGVDFCGPFKIKQSRLRGTIVTKGYVAVFVCLVTKAIHLELVSDLSVESFMMALDRFISRRGRCETIFSDNGTNFKGSANKLRELAETFKRQETRKEILDWALRNKIKWKNIPPAAPHMGGIWEAGVKSMKYYLNRTMADHSMTSESLRTLLCKIEAILNSRPLCAASDDPNDLGFITPAHFLIQDMLTSYPVPTDQRAINNRASLWKQIQQLSTSFWKHWSRDVLNTYQNRPKWNQRQRNFELGDLVLIKDKNIPNFMWKTARVVEVFPGRDGCVRTCRIKTAGSEYVRPITTLCPFPTND